MQNGYTLDHPTHEERCHYRSSHWQATIRLQHDDPLEGVGDETPLAYALMLQQFVPSIEWPETAASIYQPQCSGLLRSSVSQDLVRKMLTRIEEEKLYDRLEDVMMQPHTEGLLFTPQARNFLTVKSTTRKGFTHKQSVSIRGQAESSAQSPCLRRLAASRSQHESSRSCRRTM